MLVQRRAASAPSITSTAHHMYYYHLYDPCFLTDRPSVRDRPFIPCHDSTAPSCTQSALHDFFASTTLYLYDYRKSLHDFFETCANCTERWGSEFRISVLGFRFQGSGRGV